MLSVTFSYCFAECNLFECHYAECHSSECNYAERRGASRTEKMAEKFWQFSAQSADVKSKFGVKCIRFCCINLKQNLFFPMFVSVQFFLFKCRIEH